MQAKPEIQGIHHHVELSLESQHTEADQKSEDIDKDESDLIAVQEHQTETISGSQVVCAISRMEQEDAKIESENRQKLFMVTAAAVLALVGIYAAIILI